VIDRVRASTVLAVAVGGAIGTVARYELARAEPVHAGRFPWATFGVNVVGSLVLGLALALLVDSSARDRLARAFVAVGVCGGLTTFSTWMVESVLLVRDGDAGVATLYLTVSVLAGLAAVGAGVGLGRRLRPPTRPFVFDPAGDD
jgi:CrcB protein